MKINNKHNIHFSKKVTILLCAVALLATGFFTYLFLTPSANKQMTEQVDKTSAVKEDQIDNTTPTNSKLPQKVIQDSDEMQPDTSDTPPAAGNPEKPDISRAELSGDVVKIVASFQNQSSGYCLVEFSKEGYSSITRKSDIVVGPSYYSCSFTIQKSEFPSTGQWTTTLSHYIGTTRTEADSITIGIK